MPDHSQPLHNPRHETFALTWASGKSLGEAYITAGYSSKDPHTKGSRMAENDGIVARKKWIQEQAVTKTVLSLTEKREFIARLVRSQMAITPDDSDLWQEISVTDNGTKRKLGDKLRAIALDNDLAGDGSEAGANQAIGSMVEVMSRIRAKRWMK